MKRYFIYFSLILVLFSAASCKKDQNIAEPSADIRDPFIRDDNPGNEVDHQIYLFYKATGIPVLYSDILSKDPLTKLDVGYHLTSIDSLVTVRYLISDEDKLSGFNFVKTQIYPYLSKALYPYSILLTDSVHSINNDPNYGSRFVIPLDAYVGYNTFAISYVPTIKNMTAAELKIYRKNILKVLLSAKINENVSVASTFFAVSSAFYNKTAYGTVFTSYGNIPFQKKELYGLLTDGTEADYYYDTLGQIEDLNRYLDVALVLSAAEFESTYGSYPLVMQKYKLLLQVFKTVGFTLPG